VIRIALPLIALSATACAPPPQTTPAPISGKCDAKPVQAYLGKAATGGVVKAVVARSGARIARVIRPGQMVTMDFREDRVDIRVGPDNRILNIGCG